jgi:alkylhydroperoxidase family enzyme
MKDAALITAVLNDWRTAPVSEQMRPVLGFLEKLTLRPDEVSSEDVQPMLRAGVSDAAIEEALVVCAAFNIADRLADTFDYEPPDAEGAQRAGQGLLLRGYR